MMDGERMFTCASVEKEGKKAAVVRGGVGGLVYVGGRVGSCWEVIQVGRPHSRA